MFIVGRDARNPGDPKQLQELIEGVGGSLRSGSRWSTLNAESTKIEPRSREARKLLSCTSSPDSFPLDRFSLRQTELKTQKATSQPSEWERGLRRAPV